MQTLSVSVFAQVKIIVSPFRSYFHEQFQEDLPANKFFYFHSRLGSKFPDHLSAFSKDNSFLCITLYNDLCPDLCKCFLLFILLHDHSGMIRDLIFVQRIDLFPDEFANKKTRRQVADVITLKERLAFRKVSKNSFHQQAKILLCQG